MRYVKRSAAIAGAITLLYFFSSPFGDDLLHYAVDSYWPHGEALVSRIVQKCEISYERYKRPPLVVGVYPCDQAESVKSQHPDRTWHVYEYTYLKLRLPSWPEGRFVDYKSYYFPNKQIVGSFAPVILSKNRMDIIQRPFNERDGSGLRIGLMSGLITFLITWGFVVAGLNETKTLRRA
ncbi:hypothetical protein [Aureimonas leprariae]|uniref:Uncharacterized protein n=1 Tax=Plantimonas leprariae TaxID=2615207 RepID=A0A7V7TZU3_9HYPH|nr:hypothetical protein [Aureimonas leprariae]KAB0679776.1 hypothetical protein F6X38_11130 [Aureimonas leprariae]